MLKSTSLSETYPSPVMVIKGPIFLLIYLLLF